MLQRKTLVILYEYTKLKNNEKKEYLLEKGLKIAVKHQQV